MVGLENYSDFMDLLLDYFYEFIGVVEFVCYYFLIEKICVIVFSMVYIFFIKVVIILGLGKNSFVLVVVDENFWIDLVGKEFYVRSKRKEEKKGEK